MLFLIDVDIEYNRLGQKLDEMLAEEWKMSQFLYENKIILRIWRKANARGAVAVWDVPDLETLNQYIRKMPLYPYFSAVRLTPLVAHPKFPQWTRSE